MGPSGGPRKDRVQEAVRVLSLCDNGANKQSSLYYSHMILSLKKVG